MKRSIAALLALCCSASLDALSAPLGAPALGAGQNIRVETGEVSVAGAPITVVRYTWRDSLSHPRSVSLVPGAVGGDPGYAVQMTFEDVILETEFSNGDGGFGYFVSHEVFRDFTEGGSGTIAPFHGFDDSPFANNSNGGYTPLTGTAQSIGSTQAVHEFRLVYPHWGTVAAVPDPTVMVSSAPASHQRFDLPVVIRWSFIAGQDFPLWSMQYDLSGATNHISVDVRAPYGVMNFRKNGGIVSPAVTAIRWGDWYHFVADAGVGNDFGAAALVAGHVGWTWNLRNDGRRYNVLSTGPLEFGVVDTRIARTDTPSYADGFAFRRNSFSGGPDGSCPDAGVLQSMPCPFEWAYQSFQFDFGPPARPKLGWGTSPFLGSSLTSPFNSNTESEPLNGTGLISYGVHIVMAEQADGAPVTRALATAAPEVAPTLNVAVSPAGAGSVQYTILGNTSTFAAASMSTAPWASVRFVATPAGGNAFTSWSGACAGVSGNVCIIAMDQSRTVTANFSGAAPAGTLTPIPTSLDFGGQSMGTTSPPLNVSIRNDNGATVTITGVVVDAGFAQTNDCATLAPGATCTVTVTFTPPISAAAAVAAQVPAAGTLTVNSTAGTASVPLAGTGEKSLISHYYRSILGRVPDNGGQLFWQGQVQATLTLGMNVNEAWYALALTFFNSPEYLALNRSDTGFLGDLYRTFYNRDPDPAGQSFWLQQIGSGLPRGSVLVSFLFSPEFRNFTQGIFGNTAVRAEIDVVGDFYRGLLGRLPDSSGFNFWVGRFRSAQCLGSGFVLAQAEAISQAFATGPEYANRQRSNAQFVDDMYIAFLRRGVDVSGRLFWLGQLQSGALTREQVRQAFRQSPEFSARVQAIVNQGCLP